MASISGLSEGGWSKFVERTSKLVPRKQRAIACIVGALIADAAGESTCLKFVVHQCAYRHSVLYVAVRRTIALRSICKGSNVLGTYLEGDTKFVLLSEVRTIRVGLCT